MIEAPPENEGQTTSLREKNTKKNIPDPHVGVDDQVVWWPGRGSLGRRLAWWFKLTVGFPGCSTATPSSGSRASRSRSPTSTSPTSTSAPCSVQYPPQPHLLRLRLSSPFTFYVYEADLLPPSHRFDRYRSFSLLSAVFTHSPLSLTLACASCVATHTLAIFVCCGVR